MNVKSKKSFAVRLLSALIVVIMVVSMLPLSVFSAAEEVMEIYSFLVTELKEDIPYAVYDANVIIMKEGEIVSEGKTDLEGKVEFELPEAQYTYKVEKFGYDNVEKPVDIYSEINNVTLTAKNKRTVKISVKDTETEFKLEGVTFDIGGYEEIKMVTDSNGEFEVALYEGVTYTVTAKHSDYMKYSGAFTLQADKDVYEFKMVQKSELNLVFEDSRKVIEIKYGDDFKNAIMKNYDANLTIDYVPGNSDVATVDQNGKITTVGIGTTTITAFFAGDDIYSYASASYDLIVTKAEQKDIKWSSDIREIYVGDTFTNTLESGYSDSIATYRSGDNSIATVDTYGLVTALKAGTVNIYATKLGGDFYEDIIDHPYTLTIKKRTQAPFNFEEKNPAPIKFGETFQNKAVGGTLTTPVRYLSSDPSIAEADANGFLIQKKAGKVTITAILDGNEMYEEATDEYEIEIIKAEQPEGFHFENGDMSVTYGETRQNKAVGGKSDKTTYYSDDESIATVNEDGVVTPLKAGEVLIYAINEETDQYNKKEIYYTLTVNRAAQEVSFETAPEDVQDIVFGAKFTNKATAKTNITYESSDTSVVTVNEDGSLNIFKASVKEVKITAKAAETDQYKSAENSYTIKINKASQTIDFPQGRKRAVTFNENNNYFEYAVTSDKGLSPTYSVAEESAHLVSGFKSDTGGFTILGAGEIKVKVEFPATECYEAASDEYTLKVNKAKEDISFKFDEYEVECGIDFYHVQVDLGKYYGTGAITYSYSDDNDGIVESFDPQTGVLTLRHTVGSVKVTATKDGDNNYEGDTAEYTLIVKYRGSDKNEYYFKGLKKSGNDWFAGNVSLVANSGYKVSREISKEKANWVTEIEDIATDNNSNCVSFYVKKDSSGAISKMQTEYVYIDKEYSDITVEMISKTVWEELLTIITLGQWKESSQTVTLSATDAVSGVSSIEYKLVEDNLEIMTEEQLNKLEDWKKYSKPVKIEEDFDGIFYIKVTDIAGNVSYSTTKEVILDRKRPNVVVTPVNDPIGNHYVEDVKLQVVVDDLMQRASSSGIKKISYKIESAMTKEEEKVLFELKDNIIKSNESLTYEKDELVTYWDSAEQGKNIVIDKTKHNCDNVRVVIYAEDNAGNVFCSVDPETNEYDGDTYNICVTQPTIKIDFVDESAVIDTDNNDINYYNTAKRAKVEITCRGTVFDKNNAVVNVLAKNSKNETISGNYKISDWEYVPGDDPNRDDDTHFAFVDFEANAKYDLSVDYSNKVGFNAESKSVDTFGIDNDFPTGEISIGTDKWDTLIENLTFGLWSKEQVEVSVISEDNTSSIKSVKYYKTDSETLMTYEQLSTLAEDKWVDYESFETNENEQLTVYVKITDYAGHTSYISSNGYIVDGEPCEISIVPEKSNESNCYNDDVNVRIEVYEPKPEGAEKPQIYSGIKYVEYRVESYVIEDGVEKKIATQSGSSNFAKENPTKDKLEYIFTEDIVVEAERNNYDRVEVYVYAEDNAGNPSENTQTFKIDRTSPKIDIDYNLSTANTIEDGRGYFGAAREATVTITERFSSFSADDATQGITIKALDANGNVPLDKDGNHYMYNDKRVFDDEGNVVTPEAFIIGWDYIKGKTPDEDKHVAKINFYIDANYTFDIQYTDMAGNPNETPNTGSEDTPYQFTVDTVEPSSVISIGEDKWNTLVEVITFGIFSQDNVVLTASATDKTSPLNIKYYVGKSELQTTDKGENVVPVGLTFDDLEKISDDKWEAYKDEIKVTGDQVYSVYLKVTDNAGNYQYINSQGFIIDSNPPVIDIKFLDEPESKIYNSDVTASVSVREDGFYSGIKNVIYNIYRDGKEEPTETGELFNFNNEKPVYNQLTKSFNTTVEIDAETFNSCNVKFEVIATDNADVKQTHSKNVDIDITKPEIKVNFKTNNAYTIDESKEYAHGYFPTSREVEVTIKERSSHFESDKADAGIIVTDLKGNKIEKGYTIGEWIKTKEGQTPDEDEYTAIITFNDDATYRVEYTYTDKADNKCEVVDTGASQTPYVFTVDKIKPEATIKADNKSWDKLCQALTFGIWKNDSVTITAEYSDINPISTVSYYKTSQVTPLTETELAQKEWTPFDEFTVKTDERLVVYLRVIDYAGNTTYVSTDGIIVDRQKPNVDDPKPVIAINPQQPVNGIYNKDVAIDVKIVDSSYGDTQAYSGLKLITYKVLNMGIETQQGKLYEFNNNSPKYEEIITTWEKESAIIVDSRRNNSNDVKIIVEAVDNAGNKNQAETIIKIDTTAPEITVRYNNNDGDSTFSDGVYFKADRTATIVVKERNFDSKYVNINCQNTDGVIPVLSNWTTSRGSGNGDDTLHTATFTYNADGDYTFGINCSDMAGNKDTGVDFGDSVAPVKFTIDKTMPTLSIGYDNNAASNNNYFKAERTATITINEHNFDSSRVTAVVTAEDDGRQTQAPVLSSWSSNGNTHTATVRFANDSYYTLDIDYTDKAGNKSADIEPHRFYVDKTNPKVSITDVVDKSANNNAGNIGFTITATDTNFDRFEPVVNVVVFKNGNFVTERVEAGSFSSITNGRQYTVGNLDADGIYSITATVADKAGNAFSEVILEDSTGKQYTENRFGDADLIKFSVNRNGSTYDINDYVKTVVEKYYIQNVENDIVITEVNVDPLNEYKVTLNGETLVENIDYHAVVDSSGAWTTYDYYINKSLFADEGEYTVVVSSKDKANNNAFSDVKGASISFVVDRTPPIVSVSGLAQGGRYQVEKQVVTVIPTDDGGALKSLVVNLLDSDNKVKQVLLDLSGDELLNALEQGSGKLNFEIPEGLYQRVQIICTDYAMDESGTSNEYDEVFTEVSVSTNAFMIFWVNRLLRYSVIGGVILLISAVIFFVIYKKRKKTSK